jgi:hypothetical protein
MDYPMLNNFLQDPVKIFSPGFDEKIFFAITIAIENPIRIDQTLLMNFSSNPAGKFFTGPRLFFFQAYPD